MDYKKLYTPTEATALYNVAKIKFDPTSYTLKGNLITNCDLSEILSQHISSYNYRAEKHLCKLIENNEKRDPADEITGLSGAKVSTAPEHEWAGLCVQQDNLYVSLQLIEDIFGLDHLKDTNILQTIVTMCIALNSEKSCARDMLNQTLTYLAPRKYNDVHTLQWLRDILKDGGRVSYVFNTCSVKPLYVPTRSDELDTPAPFKYSDPLGKDTLFGHLISSFEVIWAWRHLPDAYKDCFTNMCTTANVLGKFDMGFYSRFFKLTPTEFDVCPELNDILVMDSPEARYNAYHELIIAEMPKILGHCSDYYNDEFDKQHYLNPIFAAFTSFVMQIGLVNIRINTIRILHEYCVAHGYLTFEAAAKIDVDSKGLFDKFGADLKAPTSGAAKSKKDKDLVDFSEPKEYSGIPSGGENPEAHDSSAMFEALDKVKASFSSGKYKFTVQDVKDTADESRTAYNEIASKVELVNKLLIRKIKDIKTYNVGGKNSGAPNGRLDRKAIYRYKYDPNIFYNNTYKTLESDLAFGIILDESGSMCGEGIKNGRITMVVLHETLKALGINHCMIGHTSDGKYHSDIYRYQSFREDKTYSTCKNYAIVKTEAKCGNCDSGALYYMEKAFDRVRNKDKICLIFSDGAPTECTGKELTDQVRHMERKGIKVIGIGINFSSIAKYYTDYANGRNLTDMLNIVAKILEEYVLKKKDK